MNSPVQQIKERLSIEEVVSSYIKLDKAGANLKARCPFHNEKTPSFFVSPDRGTYYCFGCGSKGDIFTFIEEFEGLDFKGALKILAEKAGVLLASYNKEKEGEKEKLYRIMEESAEFFQKNLTENKEVLKYLKERGLEDKTIKEFKIGFVKLGWQALLFYLKKKGFSDIEIEKAGLIKKIDKDRLSGEQRFYDRFRGRIIFPISDSSGRVIAFSGRIFIDDKKSVPTSKGVEVSTSPKVIVGAPTPKGIGIPTSPKVIVGAKYLNSPDTPIFSKSAVLYGLDKAKKSIRKNDFSILVEGQMDLVLSHQAGFKNTIATSGTALSDSTISRENVISNLGLLRRLSSNIVLAFDADRAGFNASMRAAKIALSLGMDVKVVSMPEGVDPADLILNKGVDAWHTAIRNSKHIIEFLLERILSDYKENTYKAGREIKEKILPYVNAIDSSIEKDNFIRKISDLSQIREEALKEDLAKTERELQSEKEKIEKVKEEKLLIFRKDYIERRLLGIIFWQRSLSKKIIDVEKIMKEVLDILNMKENELLDKIEDNKEDLIFEAEVFYGEGEKIEKDVKELLDNFKEEYLKEELNRKMREIHTAEMSKDFKKSSLILKECQIINNKIQDIKNGCSKKNN